MRARFDAIGVQTKLKMGVKTFDRAYREEVLHKGIGISDPAEIAQPFDECCLLLGFLVRRWNLCIVTSKRGFQTLEYVIVRVGRESDQQ